MKTNPSFNLTTHLPPADLQLFQHVQKQAQALHFPLYIVGGFVRDWILNRPSTDYDFVIEGDAIQLAEALVQTHGGQLTSHQDFHTAKWHPHQPNLPEHIDLISARKETYPHPAHLPQVALSNITDDLHRRDVTINTLALQLHSLTSPTLIDPFNGLQDIHIHTLRVLHDQSFLDDPTRIFRIVRFEQRLHFTIAPHTIALMKPAIPTIARLTGKRIQHEFERYNQDPHPAHHYNRIAQLGLFTHIHPAFKYTSHIAQAITTAQNNPLLPLTTQQNNQLIFILLLAPHTPIDIQSIANRLMLPTRVTKAALQTHQLLHASHSLPPTPAQITFQLDKTLPIALLAAHHLTTHPNLKTNIQTYLTQWRHIRPLVTGKDLQSLHISPGPLYKHILQDVRTQKLAGQLPTKQAELTYIKKHYLEK